MRNIRVLIIAILLLGVGGVIGWFAAKSNLLSGPVVKFVADAELLAPAPSWETWQYPGSKIHASHTGAGHSLGNIQFGNADRLALTTSDGFDEVWTFYKDKCNLLDPGNSSMTMRFEGNGSANGMTFKIFDDILAHSIEGPTNESLRARAFVVESLRYTLVGFVYRSAAAASTDILLIYRPNKEFISLLKEKLVTE